MKKIKIFQLTNHILDEHPNGAYIAIVYGKVGRGKSAYCIHTMKQIFMELYDVSIDEAYKLALEHTFFDIKDIVKKLKEAKGALKNPDKMIPVITWDDAGVYGSSYLYWTDKKLANAMKGYFDMIRTRATGFLINTPNPKGLLGFLRDSLDIGVPSIKCTKEYDWQRLATARIKKEGRRKDPVLFYDDFSCYIPKKWYYEYCDIKEKAFESVEDKINEMFDLKVKMSGNEKKPVEWNKPVKPDFV